MTLGALILAPALLATAPSRPALPVPLGLPHHIMLPATTIPSAWSGIWSFNDSTYDCGNPVPTNNSTGLDTLCTGDSLDVEGYDCSGTADNTHFDMTCTTTQPVFGGCNLLVTLHVVATRSGETYDATTTLNGVASPPGCFSDICIITNTHATRIAGEPPQCQTPVLPSSWGSIKSLYR